jgi:hypothetical protein
VSKHGTPAIRALSWDQVREIVDRFESLNPYDRDAVPGSILRIEDVNRGDDGKQREIHAYVISAKRYALFSIHRDGNREILKFSEHGLGQLLNPQPIPKARIAIGFERRGRGSFAKRLGRLGPSRRGAISRQ